MFSAIAYDPIIDWQFLALLAGASAAVIITAALFGLKGWLLRGLAMSVLLAGLLNPSYKQEDRNPLADIVFLVVDETTSQTLSDRPEQLADALAKMQSELQRHSDDPLDFVTVTVKDSAGDQAVQGTLLMQALMDAASDSSPDRIAGAIIISDGQIHDLVEDSNFPAPVHILLTGNPVDWDRRVVIEGAPAFGIVGEKVELTLRVEDNGAVPALGPTAQIIASIDGGEPQIFEVPVGEETKLNLRLDHAGINLLEISTPEVEGEITARNNVAIVTTNGVRDRLRVLLVSGEPYAGERTWRNLLKADASVDLVHFTILRPPGKQDGVPVDELALIAFPTRELFMDKIDDFDLIIFDRYRRRGILPDSYLLNVARYIQDGGAVLVAAGPAFAEVESLARSSLRDVLPALPTGRVLEEAFIPRVTELGQRHPVTQSLENFAPRGVDADGIPGWGRWFRMVDIKPRSGHIVMQGTQDKPLLILDRIGNGRIAMLASDQAWLWSRGIEGGGPQLELLRRLAHWLMQEPELEEEVLAAIANGKTVLIERRSMGDVLPDITIESPSGEITPLMLSEGLQGRWTAQFEAEENGIYRISNEGIFSVVAVGHASPREFDEPVGIAAGLEKFIQQTGGGMFNLALDGVPEIRRVGFGRVAKGNGWIGVPRREAYTVEDIRLTPLTPGWLLLLLAALLSLIAWRIEGK